MTQTLGIRRTVDDQGRVWFDGQDAAELLLRGYDITQLLITPDDNIEIYNQWCRMYDKSDHMIAVPPPIDPTSRADRWWIDDAYRDLDVRASVLAWCETDLERARVQQEMDLFEARGLIPVLRLMIQLVDHFRKNNIIWGVGRGSSVASYVLFLIGVHKINALAYGLEISEFLKG